MHVDFGENRFLFLIIHAINWVVKIKSQGIESASSPGLYSLDVQYFRRTVFPSNRYYRSVGVIVRCLVLKQPDCMSLIVEASSHVMDRCHRVYVPAQFSVRQTVFLREYGPPPPPPPPPPDPTPYSNHYTLQLHFGIS